MVDVINANESYQLKKLKRHFLLRNDVPISTYRENGRPFLDFGEDIIEEKEEEEEGKGLEEELISQKSDEKTLEFERDLGL